MYEVRMRPKPAQHCKIPGRFSSGRHISLRSDHCYITFHAYSVVVCIGINQQRISFSYPRISLVNVRQLSRDIISGITEVSKYPSVIPERWLNNFKNNKEIRKEHDACLATRGKMKLFVFIY